MNRIRITVFSLHKFFYFLSMSMGFSKTLVKMFTGNTYLWPWKGGVKDGTSIPDTYKVYPIPSSALQANQNLTQNSGY